MSRGIIKYTLPTLFCLGSSHFSILVSDCSLWTHLFSVIGEFAPGQQPVLTGKWTLTLLEDQPTLYLCFCFQIQSSPAGGLWRQLQEEVYNCLCHPESDGDGEDSSFDCDDKILSHLESRCESVTGPWRSVAQGRGQRSVETTPRCPAPPDTRRRRMARYLISDTHICDYFQT